jgi:hypothetical protein
LSATHPVFEVFSQFEAKIVDHGVVIPVENPHGRIYGAGDNLSRHEKMPQIHLSGEFRLYNAGHFGRIDGTILRP